MVDVKELMNSFPAQMDLIRQLVLVAAESDLKPEFVAMALQAVLARTLAQIGDDHARGVAIKAAEVALAPSVEQYLGHSGRLN
jgi:hypothetical protein